ncbi:MAG: type II toxin-antitoxin system RelE/ParE family toxin [Jatrophihabitantaceae bacterium]
MSAQYEIRLSHGVSRTLAEQLPLSVAAAIWEFISGPLAQNPQRLGKPLIGELAGHHSARRGSYRVIYTISDAPPVITIVRVDHRRADYHR